MFDILEAYLNLVLPPSFWVLWDLGKHYAFLSSILVVSGGLLMGLLFLAISFHRKQKESKSLEKYHLSANTLMKQGWICFDRHSHKVKASSSSFSDFINLPDLELSFESLLLVVESQERLFFREFVFSTNPHSTCTTISLLLESRCFFRVTRTLIIDPLTFKEEVLLVWQEVTALMESQKSRVSKGQRLESEIICLNRVLDSLPWPLWVSNQKTSKVHYCNEAYSDSFEVSKYTIIEHNLKLSHDFNRNYSHGVQKHFNIKGVRKLLELQEVSMGDDENVLRFAYDRTEEQALRKKLEHYLALYREVLETLSAGVVIYGPDKRVKFYNHAYIQMFGMDDKWMSRGPYVGEILDDLNRRRMLADYSDYPNYRKREINMLSGLLAPFQELMYLPDERTIRKITAPHPAGGIFYIFEDVTTSLDLERRFNTHIQVQKSTLDNLYEGIAVFGSDNRLRFTNPAFKKLWNWSPDQTQSSDHLAELLNHAKDLVAYKGSWEDYKEKIVHQLTDRVAKTRQVPLKDKRVFEFSYTPLPDGSHLFGFHDVTSFVREREDMKSAS